MADNKKKITFSVIDLVIILLALAAVAAFVVKNDYVSRLIKNEKKSTYYITFLCDGINEDENIILSESGITLYLEDGTEFCRLLSFDSYAYENNDTGHTITENERISHKFIGTATAELSELDYGYMVNSRNIIAPGTVVVLTYGQLKTEATVLTVDISAE